MPSIESRYHFLLNLLFIPAPSRMRNLNVPRDGAMETHVLTLVLTLVLTRMQYIFMIMRVLI